MDFTQLTPSFGQYSPGSKVVLACLDELVWWVSTYVFTYVYIYSHTLSLHLHFSRLHFLHQRSFFLNEYIFNFKETNSVTGIKFASSYNLPGTNLFVLHSILILLHIYLNQTSLYHDKNIIHIFSVIFMCQTICIREQ